MNGFLNKMGHNNVLQRTRKLPRDPENYVMSEEKWKNEKKN